jgi:cbb3-type cytochrome oxidase subunit 3
MTGVTLARVVITISWFALFVAIWISAWRRSRRDDYAALARLPLESSDCIPDPPQERR